ncbi:MAG: hypothetical protein KJ626_14230 [Verrucomicrobia bacterium]|nr:hypothetical protein [Verrucomicrobiota bacterium]
MKSHLTGKKVTMAAATCLCFALVISTSSCVSQTAASHDKATTFQNRCPVRMAAEDLTAPERRPTRVGARPVRVLQKPRDLGDEFSHPSSAIRQTFAWGYFGTEWRVQMDSFGYAHAGFSFSRPQDFSGSHAHCALTFKMKPGDIADHLALAVASVDNKEVLVLTKKPLSAYVTKKEQPWTYFSVNLDEFLSNSVTLNTDGSPAPASAADFTQISELRLIKLTGDAPQERIIIRNLEIRQDLWAMQQ